jgi:hypothetical protein
MTLKATGEGALTSISAVGQLSQLLFKLTGANMQSGSAQPFTKVYSGSAYYPLLIVARQRTGACSVACLGGLSDGTNAIVAATQAWVTLASGITVTATLAGLIQTTLLSATPSLTLATPSTGACTADFYIFGVDIS